MRQLPSRARIYVALVAFLGLLNLTGGLWFWRSENPIRFICYLAVALLCSGQSSTLTGTMAGQIVMEGFLNIRITPWLRRLVTRMIAILPAVVVTIWAGEKATGQLLILSQVVLSLQLPFAVVPLVMFTASGAKMGPFVAPRWLTVLAALTAALIIALNAKLVWDYVSG